MRTNHPGSAALNLTASNLTLLRFSLAILHLCGKRVCVARTNLACRIEAAYFPTAAVSGGQFEPRDLVRGDLASRLVAGGSVLLWRHGKRRQLRGLHDAWSAHQSSE